MLTEAETEYQRALKAWKRAANAAPKSRRVQYQEESRRAERIRNLYQKVDAARELLRAERARLSCSI